MTQSTDQGFKAVLANRNFRALWLAQLMAQTAQHAIHFIQLVLVEKLTGSAVQLGITILAFTVPGILFSPIVTVLGLTFSVFAAMMMLVYPAKIVAETGKPVLVDMMTPADAPVPDACPSASQ